MGSLWARAHARSRLLAIGEDAVMLLLGELPVTAAACGFELRSPHEMRLVTSELQAPQLARVPAGEPPAPHVPAGPLTVPARSSHSTSERSTLL